MTTSSGSPERAGPERVTTPFRFYDNRQKYLAFINTCNEKHVIAAKAAEQIVRVQPTPPALRIFDAGVGDATVLSRLLRVVHREFPTVPLLAVGKEISLEDVRLALEKMPDRFHEHPHTVLVMTNLRYVDAPLLHPSEPEEAARLSWYVHRLEGTTAAAFDEQITALDPLLSAGWQTKPSPTTGNPTVVQPSVLVLYRADREFLLDSVIPEPGAKRREYDFILASQPWRARMPATFKAEKILAPMARSLGQGGRLLTIQSWGNDPGLDAVQRLWPGENPFKVDRHALLQALEVELGANAGKFDLRAPSDAEAIFRYRMHTLPSEIGDRIGTSTLFAAWNAIIYVNQVEDEQLEPVMRDGSYLQVTQDILQEHGGLWFNDEAFVVVRSEGRERDGPD
jgi:hypothetical protein